MRLLREPDIYAFKADSNDEYDELSDGQMSPSQQRNLLSRSNRFSRSTGSVIEPAMSGGPTSRVDEGGFWNSESEATRQAQSIARSAPPLDHRPLDWTEKSMSSSREFVGPAAGTHPSSEGGGRQRVGRDGGGAYAAGSALQVARDKRK